MSLFAVSASQLFKKWLEMEKKINRRCEKNERLCTYQQGKWKFIQYCKLFASSDLRSSEVLRSADR
jgi:hypothetical protein